MSLNTLVDQNDAQHEEQDGERRSEWNAYLQYAHSQQHAQLAHEKKFQHDLDEDEQDGATGGWWNTLVRWLCCCCSPSPASSPSLV